VKCSSKIKIYPEAYRRGNGDKEMLARLLEVIEA